MKYIKFIIAFTVILLQFSCQKDFPYNPTEDKLVNISCFLRAGDTVSLRLSYMDDSLYYTVDSDEHYITNAVVFLYENNIFREQLMYSEKKQLHPDEKGWYYSENFIPSAGNNYSVKVYVQGYDTLYAETYIPEKTSIDSIHINGKYYQDSMEYDNSTKQIINFYFRDRASEKNYYLFVANAIFKSYDPVIESSSNGVYHNIFISPLVNAYFSDKMFDGNEYEFTIEETLYGEEFTYNHTLETKYKLNTLSYDAYMFYKTSFLYYKTFDNPLTEPVVIYSNVENGTGIFAGLSYDEKNVKIYKY